jgi:hypothetical protein
MELNEKLEPGDQVIYVPLHAEGDLTHPDCERGFVTTDNGVNVFVRYFAKDNPRRLRTTANSECTPRRFLVRKDHTPDYVIRELLAVYC